MFSSTLQRRTCKLWPFPSFPPSLTPPQSPPCHPSLSLTPTTLALAHRRAIRLTKPADRNDLGVKLGHRRVCHRFLHKPARALCFVGLPFPLPFAPSHASALKSRPNMSRLSRSCSEPSRITNAKPRKHHTRALQTTSVAQTSAMGDITVMASPANRAEAGHSWWRRASVSSASIAVIQRCYFCPRLLSLQGPR